ncbi:CcmD family protein [Dyadobacter jiangsuensis]|uniref:CcmD family protein n=1 Tax=Dyadobacter fermentans TaxID=94254 RepID=UPI001CC18498|nr:CcmD family protein [Dyadobacter fermentans]MBZ1358219.1 CcmD family protein [Dyadobacter fermentans]
MKRISLILLTLLALSGNLFAQAGDTSVEMADRLRADGKIWVVVAVVAVVFAGLAVNLFRIDSKLKKIEKDLNIK